MNAQGTDAGKSDGEDSEVLSNKAKLCRNILVPFFWTCLFYYVRVTHIPLAKVWPIPSQISTPSNASYSAWFAFFVPCYATFKSLSSRPISEVELQKWAMYWSVIGAFVAFEYVAEWFISWYASFYSYLELGSHSPHKVPVLLGSKNFVLVIFILATDTGQSPKSFLSDLLNVPFCVSGLDIHLHRLSSTSFLTKRGSFGRYPAQCADLHSSKVGRFMDDAGQQSATRRCCNGC